MRVAIASDHAGISLKETVIEAVLSSGHIPIYLGTDVTKSVDYADYAVKIGVLIQNGEAERGILLCGSGVGVNIAANKMKGVYASVCHDTYSAFQGVQHDAMNVLCIGGRVIGSELAKELVSAFLNAHFIGNEPGEERHVRRVNKVRRIEDGLMCRDERD